MAQLDAASAQRDIAHARTGVELIAHAAEQRYRAAQQPCNGRRPAPARSRGPRSGGGDRELAAVERHQALRDREALAAALDRAAVDEMTGARTRAAGLLELEHELDRTRRTGSTLAVIYIDVVGLKVLNDALGHQAGDALLKRVVAAMRAHLRPYDLIVRVGGDEFLCAMSNSTADEARERFQVIAATIGQSPNHGKIRTGFAQSGDIHESVANLVARADRELIGAAR